MASDESIAVGRWLLMRQDDNGNAFSVGAFTDRESAARALEAFERSGHKQTYWLELADDRTR